MHRIATLAVAVVALAACAPALDPGPELGEEAAALSSLNKVSLNKVSLNKVSLNKVSLNALGLSAASSVGALTLPTASLGQAIDDYLLGASATASGTGFNLTFRTASSSGTAYVEATASELRDLVDKSVRCINPAGTTVTFNGEAFAGMWGAGSRKLSARQFVETYMGCLAVYANTASMSINVTADLPKDASADVRTSAAEFATYKVPDVAVAYGVTATTAGDTTTFTGRWYWNISRSEDYAFGQQTNLWGWQASKGTAPADATTGRVCLDAALARQAMPAACGGAASVPWTGRLTPQLVVPAEYGAAVLCAGRLLPLATAPARGTLAYNDYVKGVGCGATGGGTANDFAAVFYAELPATSAFADVEWGRLAAAYAAYGGASGTGGTGGTGSGGGGTY